MGAKQTTARAIMFGLNNSGKTSAMYLMKLNENVTTIPSISHNCETIECNNVKIELVDTATSDGTYSFSSTVNSLFVIVY